MKYYSIGEFVDRVGKTIQTLRNWDKKNILKPSHVTQGGTRYYSQEQLNHFLGLKSEKQINKKIIGYCRVSSHKQKDDLERQIEVEKIEQQELVEDLVQLVTVFSFKLEEKGKNKAKKTIKELIEDDKDIKDNADS